LGSVEKRLRPLKEKTIPLKPIGFVRSPQKEGTVKDRSLTSEIVLEKTYSAGLEGLEGFSHLYVIYWLHKIREAPKLKVHPWGSREMPLLGVFATRSPSRPNPLGLTLVELLEREDCVLKVRGLDALDGSPVLDLKPFDFSDVDEYRKVRVPGWWVKAKPEKWKKWKKLVGGSRTHPPL